MIRVENVWKKYARHEALRGLSFSVPEGSAYALIGANGAGKTTTIKILMNIIEAARGTATVLNVESRRLSPRELARIGYVSENQDMPERLTVGEYLDYLRPFYRTWDKALEASIRRQLRLPAGRRIGELSHGMRMKMALACALPYRPKLLILDEPFSGLDPLVRDEFMEGILSQAGEMTILISSHELGEIDGVATHVAFLDEGRLLFEESMSDLTARCRAVRVVMEDEAAIPERAPAEWLAVRATGNVLMFVDTRFSEAGCAERLGALNGGVKRVEVEAMPLRSIFTAMAGGKRPGRHGGGTAMTWRIFRKDWKLLWPVALGVAAINFLLRLMLARVGLFPSFHFGNLLNLLVTFGLWGTIVLITLAVQQDALPGVRQDWLVRPIRRRDVALSKVLFVLLLAQGPVFLAEAIEGLLTGFSPAAAVGPAFARNAWLVGMVDLPILASATLTANLMEAIVRGLVLSLGGTVAIGTANVYMIPQPTMYTGIQWVTYTAMALFGTAAAIAVIALQYRRRKTRVARAVFACAGLCWLAMLLTPWTPAFAVEKRLSPQPAAASQLQMAFAPEAGRYQAPPGSATRQEFRSRAEEATNVYLPMRVANLPEGSMLLVDRAEARFTPPGTSVDVTSNNFQIAEAETAYQPVRVPVAWMARHENEPVQVEIDYSLTLVGQVAEYSIPDSGGELRAPELGWCGSRINDADTAVTVHCMKPGNGPAATAFSLENPRTGAANPRRILYTPNYAPYFQAFEPDSMTRFGTGLPFRDETGLAKFPVDEAQIGEARVKIRTYAAREHFTRTVSLDGMRLGGRVEGRSREIKAI